MAGTRGPCTSPDGLPEREGSKFFPLLRFLLMQQCGLKSYLKNKLFQICHLSLISVFFVFCPVFLLRPHLKIEEVSLKEKS